MSLERFFDEVTAPPKSLIVVNRSAPQPVQTLLENTFENQPVEVGEDHISEAESNVVFLVEETDAGREVLASSPLSALEESILLVNSDLYKTGSKELSDFELPDVLAGLDDVPLRLQGYPESNKEKLLLIILSRFIERRAWLAGRGTLRTAIQRLSRINDERGTRAVYDTVSDQGVQTHVYGVPDWQPPLELDVVSHGGFSEEFQKTWFVVYRPPEDGAPPDEGVAGPAALLALEVAPREWHGFWTFRPDLVADIEGYITANM